MAKPSLTREQEAIVKHRNAHLQVIACAGAGKTEAISQRVAELLCEGVQPNEIVAFTFTERAAESMKDRILRRVTERQGQAVLDRLGPMFVGTIHSYCFRMLQDHVPQFADYDLLDEHRQAGILSREYKRLGLDQLGDRHWGPIHQFVRHADVVENELIPPKKLNGTAFGRVYADYCAMLERYHFLTYGQLIVRAVQALEDPAIFERVHGPLKHLIVDEYQDINPAQERLISLLGRFPVHVCVVGDDDQAIYQWRGSDVEQIQEFPKRYKGASTLPLSENRRSRPQIIQVANRFAVTISPRLKKKMEPVRKGAGPEVCFWSAENPEQEAEVIADAILDLRKKGFRFQDCAVLLRSVRTSAPPILDVFRKREIPFRCAGRTGLFLQPEAQVLGQTYAWILDNEWKEGPYSDSLRVELSGLLDQYAEVFRPAAGARARLKTHLEGWKSDAADSGVAANLVLDFYRLLRLLGVHEWDLQNPVRAAKVGGLARFSQLLADFEHVARRARWVEEEAGRVYRGGQNAGTFYYRRLFNYMQYYALEAYEDFEGEDALGVDAVDLITVHQAKGLEWPVVFVPCLVVGRFPSKNAGKEEEWLFPDAVFPKEARRRYDGSEADERRLFYVAMTRARDALYLSRFRRMTNRRRASTFLLEVAGQDPEIASALPLPSEPESIAGADDEKPTIPFTELAGYEDCPLGYRLRTLLGFQPSLAEELGYGRAIHHALRRIADHVREKNKLPSRDDVERLFREEFYLPFARRIAYEKLRNAARRLVDRYLAKYSDDLFRIWQTERPFELHLESGVVSGRADVILDREGGQPGSLALVDYKTSTEEEAAARYQFQLAIYTAAGKGEGLNMRAAYLHDLDQGDRVPVAVGEQDIEKARIRAGGLMRGLLARQFSACSEKRKCGQCDVRLVCRHGPGK
jgi:DNA helicase-2/ATP-dependent DNA helicase PcrA